jgi:hypothetical protein
MTLLFTSPLLPHGPAPHRVWVRLKSTVDSVRLRYAVSNLEAPPSRHEKGFPLLFSEGSPKEEAHRRDGLWMESCAELFVARDEGAYREFNFAPSGAWACYDFSAYREAAPSPCVPAPRIRFHQKAEGPALWDIELPRLALPAGDVTAFQCAAILKTAAHGLSYWALRHARTQQPDFHAPEGFSKDPQGLELLN